MKLTRKTIELLLVNYNNINNAMLKPCAEKTKFINLINDLELQLKNVGREITYPDGMSVMEYAKHLAHRANAS
jgi:hypothetical protein